MHRIVLTSQGNSRVSQGQRLQVHKVMLCMINSICISSRINWLIYGHFQTGIEITHVFKLVYTTCVLVISFHSWVSQCCFLQIVIMKLCFDFLWRFGVCLLIKSFKVAFSLFETLIKLALLIIMWFVNRPLRLRKERSITFSNLLIRDFRLLNSFLSGTFRLKFLPCFLFVIIYRDWFIFMTQLQFLNPN